MSDCALFLSGDPQFSRHHRLVLGRLMWKSQVVDLVGCLKFEEQKQGELGTLMAQETR